MPEQLVTVDGVRLCLETFGRPTDPALLLIGGAVMSMDWWDVGLCERLADEDRFVVRYDHRDTGRSEASPLRQPSYTSADLATDALRILDAIGIERAHLLGLSMGGGIAQQLAATRAERLLSITLVATGAAGERSDPAPLPPPDPRIASLFDNPPADPDWADDAAVVDHVVDGFRPYAGSLGFDAARTRRLATIAVRRTPDMAASLANHWVAESGPSDPFRLADIDVPTLVLHGTTDPFFPLAHGRSLAAEIPDASLVPLEGMGHEVPPPQLWDVVVPAVGRHTSGARSARG